MGLKTKIKNDLWRVNYIIPFVKKHQFDEKGKFHVLKKVAHAYVKIRPVTGAKSLGGNTKKLLSEINITLDTNSHFVYFIDETRTLVYPGNILSNFTLDYSKIIEGTFEGLVSDAEGSDAYGIEAHLVAEGISILLERIIHAVNESDYMEESKLQIKKWFKSMLIRKAEHFDEALQRILFFNQILWQTRHRLNGLGRLDKILWKIYISDIEDGVLSKQDIRILISDFLTQLNKYEKYKSDALEGDIGQIIVLGGRELDGSYLYNDLTAFFMEEQAKLRKPDPKILLRVCNSTPDVLISKATECLAYQTGSPLFSNDDKVISALLDFGIEFSDAHEYCTSACWEPFIVGKSLDQNNIGVFDFFPSFEDCLEKEYPSYEELIKKYLEINTDRFRSFLEDVNQMKIAKDPLVSLFTEGCSSRREDISTGSCIYKNYGITTVAISSVVDSLFQIKKLVFEEKRFTLSELNGIRKNNYSDNEDLYLEILEARKHYGHDEASSIALVNKITASMSEVARNWKNIYGGTVKFGLSSPGYNILGRKAAADFAGRKRGMPYSTHISCVDASYTEMVNFAGKLDYDKQRYNGNVVDFFVSPNLVTGKEKYKFDMFLKGAISAGFFQMQMNVMDSKTLIDAKKHPERYAGLIVRVWGFSAYFNELPESYKDLLIERALAAEQFF